MRRLGYVLLLAFVIACKGGGGGGSVITPVVVANGVYQVCQDQTDDGVSFRSTVYLNESMLSEVSIYYTGLGCGAGNEDYEERATYSYTKSGGSYRLVFEGLTATSLSNSDLTWNNTNTYCGYNNWLLNVPKTILGQSCLGDTISQGDFQDVTVSNAGTGLVVVAPGGTFTYALTGAWNFANQGQTVSNGNWAYYDGASGAYLTTNGGSYTISYFDKTTMRYFTENGTYTSANNVMQITVGTYSHPCATDGGTTTPQNFTQTAFSLALQGESANEGLLFEKVSFTQAQFISSVLSGGYTAGCF